MKTIGRFFEPLYFILVCTIFSLLWILKPSFRTELRKLKTGRSKVVIARLLSKRFSVDMPLLIPGTLITGAAIGYFTFYSLLSLATGAVVSFGVLTLFPLLFPVPSTSL